MKMFGAAMQGPSLRALLGQPIAVVPAGQLVCNRSACRRPLDNPHNMWWNFSTQKWYCQKCALLINEGCPGLLVRRHHANVAALIDEKAGAIE